MSILFDRDGRPSERVEKDGKVYSYEGNKLIGEVGRDGILRSILGAFIGERHDARQIIDRENCGVSDKEWGSRKSDASWGKSSSHDGISWIS